MTTGRGEGAVGLVVTSLVSISPDPPTLLFAVQRGSAFYSRAESAESFAVNVLAADQRELADGFGRPAALQGASGEARGDWFELPSGVLGLAHAAAVLDCEVEERLERATHAILIGRVRHVLIGDGSGALLYWQAGFDPIGWRTDEIARATGL